MILEFTTFARKLLRKTKLTGLAHKIRMLWHRPEYEDQFADVLLASIQPGDCVWDIGANIGFYTERFSKVARQVVAFEPIFANWEQIESKHLSNVECLQVALGDVSGEMSMFVDNQFSSIAVAPYPGAPEQKVRVVRGDSFSSLPRPTVAKIDVEGYELEVFRGLQGILDGVRALFIEVHFQVLSERGMEQAPAALVKDLKRAGFARIQWPDASHIAAFRA